jgi:16S rRNA (cytidine1402-2'-O)-methyltransferase
LNAKLYIIPTPVGNLEDITHRALRLLKEVDLLYAEDTRTSGNLLRHFQVDRKLFSFHQHNEHASVDRIVQQLEAGQTVGLVSDAGTPGISDPGFLLVRACVEKDIEVECLPGATAFVPALVQSGFPCDKFCFEGFLPHKKGRQKRLKELADETRTIVFYESPFRVEKALEEFTTYFGPGRRVTVCREISKLYHETVRGTAPELLLHFKEKGVKGEIVIVVEGKQIEKNQDSRTKRQDHTEDD